MPKTGRFLFSSVFFSDLENEVFPCQCWKGHVNELPLKFNKNKNCPQKQLNFNEEKSSSIRVKSTLFKLNLNKKFNLFIQPFDKSFSFCLFAT